MSFEIRDLGCEIQSLNRPLTDSLNQQAAIGNWIGGDDEKS